MTRADRVCVIGVGNRDCGDDGAGPRVLEQLESGKLPGIETRQASGEPATLIELLSQYRSAIIVDAVATQSRPGTIHRFDASDEPLPTEFFANYSTHGMGVDQAIEMTRALGCLPQQVLVYGIEGRAFDAGDAMTAEVEQNLNTLAERIRAEITVLQSGNP